MKLFNIAKPAPKMASSIIMCRPFHFGFNHQTGEDNSFQHRASQPEQVQQQAMKEFENALIKLTDKGVEVLILEHPRELNLPDAVFPNNWFTTHQTGEVILYPMKTPNRQQEVVPDLLCELLSENGYCVGELIDLSANNDQSISLEGTGAIVFDHWNYQAYAGISERCEPELFNNVCNNLHYTPVTFNTESSDAMPFYHTNVMMSIGKEFCVICSDAITGPQRKHVLNQLSSTEKQIINVTHEQAEQSFCCNILQLESVSGEPVIAMSQNAYRGFNTQQISLLERFGSIAVADISTIEYIGGGSLRCMLAENFLPLAENQS